MKKIINSTQTVVSELCEGMVKAYPKIVAWDRASNVIHRLKPSSGKVTLISGGGSGHEPSHAGFVGKGMLDAAVCGEVFASPSIMQVYRAIQSTVSDKGVLLIIKNYAGDMMNFSQAAEMAIEEDGILIGTVCVNDDVAIDRVSERRGVAGTVFVHKIAGALAEEGADLREVKAVAEKVVRNVRTMGVALEACTVPAKGEPTFSLGPEEIEMGVGIHGEAGVFRGTMKSAADLAEEIVGRIVSDLPFKSGDEAALLINGLGGTPLQELFILNNEARKIVDGKGITVYRTLVGNYMTSIDMVGASVTLLRLDDELKRLLDAPADTAAWKTCG
ncbi:MAG: dihydroxyacetone kinase subunit DhaK [Spirochaetes bacterium]|nr:dihydroxyacetone kinase subunit DhaK [Spirochaetota bacterium]